MRSPLTLRDVMILPVRTGYVSDKIDPADLPPSAEVHVPSPRLLLLSAFVQARQ